MLVYRFVVFLCTVSCWNFYVLLLICVLMMHVVVYFVILILDRNAIALPVITYACEIAEDGVVLAQIEIELIGK